MVTTRKTTAKTPTRSTTSPKAQASNSRTSTKKSTAKSTAQKTGKAAKKTPTKKPAAKPARTVVRRSALGFRVNESVIYPAHGVGQITEIVNQEIAGMSLDLFVINFEKEKMVLRIPLNKTKQVGMRTLAGADVLEGAMKTLRGRARIKRTMWSRRAQEYEAKINSGDLIAISEVVRDLFRNQHQPEQSYSERQLYEAALERMAREVAAIQKTTEDEAIISLETILAKATGGVRRQPDINAA